MPVPPRHPRDAEVPGQGALGVDRGNRGGGALEPVQALGVELPPPAVPLGLDLGQHQVVDVQLRVPGPGSVLPERPDHPVPGVLPSAQLSRGLRAGPPVVAGAGHPRLVLQVLQGGGVALHDRIPHQRGLPLPLAGPGRVPGLPQAICPGEQPAVEQGDRLRHRHGDVPERHRVPRPRPGQRPQFRLPGVAGVRLRRNKVGVDGVLGGEPLRRPAQPGLPCQVARVGVLVVQRLEHRPVDHLPLREPERGQAAAGPPARRLPALVRRGQVVLQRRRDRPCRVGRADLPPRVRRVEPGVDLQHDGHRRRPRPRSFVNARV